MITKRPGSMFHHRSVYPCTAQELYDWHSRPGALERLLAPWDNTTILARAGGIDPGGQVLLKMHFGPFPFHYRGRHVEKIPGRMFRDVQEKGPFRQWSHSHFFQDTEEGAELRDVIEYCLPGHVFLPEAMKSLVTAHLQQLFHYRQAVLREDILLHRRCSQRPMRILVTGASGILGSDLLPLLTTGGHQVFTLVRRRPDPAKGEFFWDPEQKILNGDELPEVDGVIHLAGEYIGLSRWSERQKQRVIDSRVNGTELLARTLSARNRKPAVLLSASAVGYYGDCGDKLIDETEPSGNGFMPKVCRLWEEATEPARNAGIRTVFLRMGVGLTPRGGALGRILAASPAGFIRSLGDGGQYISWISRDDMIAAMLHALSCKSLSGPLNIAAPQPVTNRQFMRTLSRVTGRPLLLSLPGSFLKMLYGQMAWEILLSSCRVKTDRLSDSGFQFRHPDLECALRTLLGKEQQTPLKIKG